MGDIRGDCLDDIWWVSVRKRAFADWFPAVPVVLDEWRLPRSKSLNPMSCFSCLWMSTNLFDGHRILANSLFISNGAACIVNGRQTASNGNFLSAIWHDLCAFVVALLVTGSIQPDDLSLSLRYSCRHCVSIANSPLHQSPTLLLTTCQTLSLSPKTVGWWSVPSKRNRSFSKHLEGILPLLKNKQPNTINKKNIQFRRLLHLLHACSTMLALAQWTLLIELPVPRALGCVWHFSVCKLRIRIRYGQQVAAWFLWCVQSMWMHFADALVRQCPGNESQCIARRCEHQPLCWQGRSLDRPIGGAVNYKYNER